MADADSAGRAHLDRHRGRKNFEAKSFDNYHGRIGGAEN
jgi:hypothetical protein